MRFAKVCRAKCIASYNHGRPYLELAILLLGFDCRELLQKGDLLRLPRGNPPPSPIFQTNAFQGQDTSDTLLVGTDRAPAELRRLSLHLPHKGDVRIAQVFVHTCWSFITRGWGVILVVTRESRQRAEGLLFLKLPLSLGPRLPYCLLQVLELELAGLRCPRAIAPEFVTGV